MKQIVTADLEQELRTTRRMLERAPAEHFGWKPHEKSMTLGRLVTHITNLIFWQKMTLETEGFDFEQAPPQPAVPETTDALLQRFDDHHAALRETVEAIGDEVLNEPWTLRRGDHVIFTHPKGAVLRSFGISHLIHHRGQLSVYLRLLGVPVPPSYGPTADER